MLEIANQLSEDGKYIQALQYYKNILQIEQDNIGVIIDYGVTLQNLEFYYQEEDLASHGWHYKK